MAQAGQQDPAINLGAGGFRPAGPVSYFEDGGAAVTHEEARAAFLQLPLDEQLRIEAEERRNAEGGSEDIRWMVDLQEQIPPDFRFGGKYGLPSYLAYTGGVPFDKGRMAVMRTFGHDPDNPGGTSLIVSDANVLGKYLFPDSRPEADGSNAALASTTLGGIGSLEPDTLYYQQALPFDDPTMNAYYPETSMTPGAVVSHELMHRSAHLPEIQELYNEYASGGGSKGLSRYEEYRRRKYRDAGQGHVLLDLLEAEMDVQKGWSNPEAITELMKENPELSLEEARQAVKDTGDMKFGDPLTDRQNYVLARFAKFNKEYADFLREKGVGDPRFLIPRDAPPEPPPPTAMDAVRGIGSLLVEEIDTVKDTIRKQLDIILGRKPED